MSELSRSSVWLSSLFANNFRAPTFSRQPNHSDEPNYSLTTTTTTTMTNSPSYRGIRRVNLGSRGGGAGGNIRGDGKEDGEESGGAHDDQLGASMAGTSLSYFV